jgi:hypothetical protein
MTQAGERLVEIVVLQVEDNDPYVESWNPDCGRSSDVGAPGSDKAKQMVPLGARCRVLSRSVDICP